MTENQESDPKDIERLSKQDRLTEKVSPKMVEEIVRRLEGLRNGGVHIYVKNGYVLGIETREKEHFTSRGA